MKINHTSMSTNKRKNTNAIEELDPLMLDENEDKVIEENEEFLEYKPFNQLDSPFESIESFYALEKDKKKLVIKNKVTNKIINTKHKDNYGIKFTSYNLWAKEIRKEIVKTDPNLDFSMISKRLGELWSTVPIEEKRKWTSRAKKLTTKISKQITKAKMRSYHGFVNESTVVHITGISRSGRVIKKSSKLAGFEDLDSIEEQKLKKQKTRQYAQPIFNQSKQQTIQSKLRNIVSTQEANSTDHINAFCDQNNLESNILYMTENTYELISENKMKSFDNESENIKDREKNDESSSESIIVEEVDPLMLNDVEIVEENTSFTKLKSPKQSEISSKIKKNLYILDKCKTKLTITENEVSNEFINIQENYKSEVEILLHLKN